MDVEWYLDQALWSYHDLLENEWHAKAPNVPSTLYHYTHPHAFRSIFESGVLWATASGHLNDLQEVTHAGNILRNVLQMRAEAATSEEREILYPASLVDLDYGRNDVVHTYAASLSGTEDDRTQWNLYAEDSYGLAIGFDTQRLSRMGRPTSRTKAKFGLEHIVYDRVDQEEFLEFAVDGWAERARAEMWRPLSPLVWRPGWHSCWYSIFSACISGFLPRMKSHHFQSENEWRLGHLHAAGDCACTVKERQPGSVPYVELLLADSSGHMPVASVWLSPGFANAKSVRAVEEFLGSLGYGAVSIQKSAVPLRIDQMELSL